MGFSGPIGSGIVYKYRSQNGIWVGIGHMSSILILKHNYPVHYKQLPSQAMGRKGDGDTLAKQWA